MCSKHPELEADIRRIIGGCNEMLQPIPESIRALKRLTMDGYDCYFLSNTNASAMEYMNGFDYMGMFKGGIEQPCAICRVKQRAAVVAHYEVHGLFVGVCC